MTELLDQAIARVRALAPETQDAFARMLLDLAGDEAEPVILTRAERDAIATSKSAAARGEFATDEEVRAVWAKHGL
ncbi:hypothetical protein AO398_03330 [Methylobacterium sp. GXS13]|jgi:hypothetical protein|uniref:hypothetical protein n=1 Tax=Methylobacterium sp. GXS13 TaxID=1730094 RepID=UPI00071B25B0|nr:hypothetical protein [Methylobacterium sp. GXS13]KST59924.1 hypothetical protein AO398_03330 [Methylobacterium sp. GXS13]